MKKYFSFKFSFLFSTLLLILISESGFAQLAVPFKVRYQSHVKGDMTIIANTIVNRTESKNATSEPYNDISEKAKLNDEFEMAYIDIDNDETTFSSSSAQLNLTTSTTKKVIYAGLYWSALYKYESGIRDKKWNYIAVDNKRTSVNEIKFKLPGKSDYIDIAGEVLFDGLEVKNFKESAPYAAYADVTRYIQSLENPNGDYTVANIKATQGIISGGVAGGWSLFIVFEDDSETEKFITSFDGFVGITTRPVEISFTGFSTLPEGKVNAKLACAALEGDRNLTGDQLEIKSGDNLKYSLLSHPLKPADNFFNSTIIINDDYFELRNPNSLNTLGYDTCLLQINNQNNAIIQNNSSKVSLKLKSSGDRYSMFFSAFNVEVSDPLKKIDSAELVSTEKKQ
ncbi:MAG TPA: adhesin, partial [Flavobacterium sp.]|nr:adhesin [Flavobacterium sp.]